MEVSEQVYFVQLLHFNEHLMSRQLTPYNTR